MAAAKYIRKAVVTIVRGPNKGGKYTRYFYKGGAKKGAAAKKLTSAQRAQRAKIQAQLSKKQAQINKIDNRLADVRRKITDAERAENTPLRHKMEEIELNLMDKADDIENAMEKLASKMPKLPKGHDFRKGL